MSKFFLYCLIWLSIIIASWAIYLLTDENVEKTLLMQPPILSVFYLLYQESVETTEVDVVEQWAPVVITSET